MDLQTLRTIWAFPGELVLHECKLSSSGQSRKECLARGLFKCPNNGYAKPASKKEGANRLSTSKVLKYLGTAYSGKSCVHQSSHS